MTIAPDPLRAALVAHGRTFPARLLAIASYPLPAWNFAYDVWKDDLANHRERVRAYWHGRNEARRRHRESVR